jgi:hypothetical protein
MSEYKDAASITNDEYIENGCAAIERVLNRTYYTLTTGKHSWDKMHVVVLSGKKRVGKSESASYLTSRRSYKEYTLASNIYDIHYELLDRLNIGRKKIRKSLQTIGDLGCLLTNGYGWTGNTIEKIMDSSHNRVVISDMRKKKELELIKMWLKEYNIPHSIIRINRPSAFDPNDPTSFHESETELDDYPFNDTNEYIIENEKTKKDLYDEIDKILDCNIS